MTQILVVAATERELVTGQNWVTLVCGVGPVEAAIATATAIARARPSFVLHVGIAGARRVRALPPASLVIGRASCYCDLLDSRWAPRTLTVSERVVAAAQDALPSATTGTIGTSARVGGTRDHDVDVEAMEGFSVLRAAQVAGVPALEVRAISNEIEEADRSRWHVDAAVAAISGAIPPLVAALAHGIKRGGFRA